MFEAGRVNLFALCSEITKPVSSDTILTAKKPGSSAGCRTISSMRDFSSARVAGAFRDAATGRDTTGEVAGEGIGVAVGFVARRRSRCALAKLTGHTAAVG